MTEGARLDRRLGARLDQTVGAFELIEAGGVYEDEIGDFVRANVFPVIGCAYPGCEDPILQCSGLPAAGLSTVAGLRTRG